MNLPYTDTISHISPKAGQGMNVSMQDSKLEQVHRRFFEANWFESI